MTISGNKKGIDLGPAYLVVVFMQPSTTSGVTETFKIHVSTNLPQTRLQHYTAESALHPCLLQGNVETRATEPRRGLMPVGRQASSPGAGSPRRYSCLGCLTAIAQVSQRRWRWIAGKTRLWSRLGSFNRFFRQLVGMTCKIQSGPPLIHLFCHPVRKLNG